MMTIIFTQSDGAALQIEGKVGLSLMEVAVQNDVRGIAAECGGACACATCHVYLDEDVGAPSRMEDDMLDFAAAERRPNSRLSCQVKLADGIGILHVTIPECQ